MGLLYGYAEMPKEIQPGIESAEAKIKLWNVAERLLFKKGEIIVCALRPQPQ